MNWQEKIKEIIDSGMSQTEIATHAGCSNNTIHMQYRGKTLDPTFELGNKILELNKKAKAKAKRANKEKA